MAAWDVRCVTAAIIPDTYYGRVDCLFVKKGARLWGIFNEQENQLHFMNEENQGAEDLIDRAVVKTIQNGGEVYFMEADQMPEPAELAAILRY